MLLLRSIILSALLVLAAPWSSVALADHPPYAVGILEGTDSPVNRQVISLIAKKDFKQLRELFNSGTSVNAPDSKGGRPIHFASIMGSVEAVKLFAELGGNLRATTFGGWTPLHYAVFGGHSGVADFLINSGLPIDASDSGGESPLYYAIESGNLVMVRWMVERGANVNHENNKGETPLSIANESNYKQIAEYLKTKGAKEGGSR